MICRLEKPVPLPRLKALEVFSRLRYSSAQHMGVDEVLHVDVVPDAGAVRRGVVGTEELQAVPPALRHRQDERDEVGLRPVILADGAVRPAPATLKYRRAQYFRP